MRPINVKCGNPGLVCWLAAGFLSLAAILSSVHAQTAATGGAGAEVVVSQHDAWEVRCRQDSARPCFMVQSANDESGNPIIEFSIIRFAETSQGVVAGATAIVPLGTALPEGLAFRIDQGGVLIFAYDFCTRGGCVSNLALTQAQVDSMKAGSVARVTITPALRPDQQLTLPISLIGFTAAFESMVPAAQ